jgi:hypothetical protein
MLFVLFKVGAEESIVNAQLVSLWSKNTNNAKSEVRFKQVIHDLSFVMRIRLFNAYFEDKFKRTLDMNSLLTILYVFSNM